MIHTVLNLAIVCGAMFIAVKAVDLLFRWLNFAPKQEGIQPSKPEQITGRVIDSLQLAEYSPHHVSAVSSCEIEAGAVCDEIANSAEGLVEGIQALAESAGEHASTIIEGLSSQ